MFECAAAFFVSGNAELVHAFLQFCETVSANVFAFVIDDIASLIAENAGRFIFFEQDVFIVNIDLNRIFFVDIECASQLDW